MQQLKTQFHHFILYAILENKLAANILKTLLRRKLINVKYYPPALALYTEDKEEKLVSMIIF